MKKSRGQRWQELHNMRTADEIEAKVANMQKTVTKRVDRMTAKINAMNQRINEKVKAALRESRRLELEAAFADGDKINFYTWTHERAFLNRQCFTSNKTILVGKKAYKGTIAYPDADSNIQYHLMPKEIWLTGEEFTIRRLKGQL